MSKLLTLLPRVSEKTYGLSQRGNVYAFRVPLSTNKLEIAQAVAAQYGVAVLNVRCLVQNGKPKRAVRKGGKATQSKRADMKKAYVTLKQGDSIPVFAGLGDADNAQKSKEEKR